LGGATFCWAEQMRNEYNVKNKRTQWNLAVFMALRLFTTLQKNGVASR